MFSLNGKFRKKAFLKCIIKYFSLLALMWNKHILIEMCIKLKNVYKNKKCV